MVLELVFSHCDDNFFLQYMHYDLLTGHYVGMQEGNTYVSASNLERSNDTFADLVVRDCRADLVNDTTELVAEDVALLHLDNRAV